MNGRLVRLGWACGLSLAAAAFLTGGAIAAESSTSAASVGRASSAPLMQLAASATPDAPAMTPLATPLKPQAELSDDQRAEVEAIVKNYLIAHPEIIREAMDELQRREDAAAAAQQVKAITDNQNLLFSSKRQVVLGNPNGDVTLVEFFDYNCTYCRRAQADMKALIASDKNLRVVLKEFPVLGDGSVEAAQVAVAVNMIAPEKYGEYHDAMLGERGQLNGERALAVAEDIGIDKAKLAQAMKSDEVKATIAETYDLASKLALSGTPSYVTAKEVVVGAVGVDALKQKIQAARCSLAATC